MQPIENVAMSYIFVLVVMLVALFSIFATKDIFSPGKVYLLFFVIFYGEAFVTEQSLLVWLLIGLVFCVGATAIALENFPVVKQAFSFGAIRYRRLQIVSDSRFLVTIWVMSMPGLALQIWLVYFFGGIESYVTAVGFRVIEFAGLGPARSFIAALTVLNVIYFGVSLLKQRSWMWWALYFLHLLAIVFIGLLSGSRGALLSTFIFLLFVIHYSKHRVSLLPAVVFASAVLIIAIVLGAARDNLKIEDGNLRTGLDDQELSLKTSTFRYGIIPLEIIASADELKLAYGVTFLTVFTNVVPRTLWPDKPDTGGVFFTKVYTGDAWEGASNLTPSLLGETIINFGWFVGPIVFVVCYVLLMITIIRYYCATLNKMRDGLDEHMVIDLVIYLTTMWMVVGLMSGEFTNTLVPTTITQILPAMAVKALLGRRQARHVLPHA